MPKNNWKKKKMADSKRATQNPRLESVELVLADRCDLTCNFKLNFVLQYTTGTKRKIDCIKNLLNVFDNYEDGDKIH